MTNWQTCTLGELLEIKHGYAFKGEYFSDNGEFILLTPGNFQERGGIKLKGEKEKYYLGAFPEEFLLHRGDLLVAMTDLTQNAPILGSPAFVPDEGLFLHNQRLGKIINLKQCRISSEFLFYLLSLASVRDQIKAGATGATVRHTSPSRIYDVEVLLPPLPIQHRIAGILSAYDDLIENSQRRIKILEEMARRLYREWFINFRFPGHEGCRFVETPLGEIPEGWEVVSLGDLYSTGSGGTPSRVHPEYYENGTIDWVKSQELLDGFVLSTEERITEAALKKSSARLFPADTVLIALYGATIGKLAILSSPAATNQACCAVLPKHSAFGREFAFFTLLLNRERIIGLRLGAAQQNISQVLLRNFECLKPPIQLLHMFSDHTAPLLDQTLALQRQIQNLRRTRDLLLPRLLSGQIDVEALPEPTLQEVS
jgi:type I restriction enzyme S subunit